VSPSATAVGPDEQTRADHLRFETFVGVPFTEENVQQFLHNVPLGRLTHPTDVANYCLFLASDEAKFITGTCLEVDGGRGI
jgi:NAD(P)-dependent dehydrogenase (short-subunit alcohol dehydrogenase family)